MEMACWLCRAWVGGAGRLADGGEVDGAGRMVTGGLVWDVSQGGGNVNKTGKWGCNTPEQ